MDEPVGGSAAKNIFGDDSQSSDSESSASSSSSDSDSDSDDSSIGSHPSNPQQPLATVDNEAVSKKRPVDVVEEDVIDESVVGEGEEGIVSAAPGKRARILEDSDSD